MNKSIFNDTRFTYGKTATALLLLSTFSAAGFQEDRFLIPTASETFGFWKFSEPLHPLDVHFSATLFVIAAIMELTTFKKNGFARAAEMKKQINAPVAQPIKVLEESSHHDGTLNILLSGFSRDMMMECRSFYTTPDGIQKPEMPLFS